MNSSYAQRCLIGLLLLWGANLLQAQPKVIAHRGYWNSEGAAQNSIAALRNAARAGVYGSEFDVFITADGIPIVNHDDTLAGYVIEQTPYDTLANVVLSNGEQLPTLRAYLDEGRKTPAMQLILEIKPHRKRRNERRAVAAITAMVAALGMKQQVQYISFSLHICKQLVKHTPGSQIAYLRGDLNPAKIERAGLTGLDYHHSIIRKYPEWVAMAHRKGLSVNVWTVNDRELMQTLIDAGVDYITTDDPQTALSLTR